MRQLGKISPADDVYKRWMPTSHQMLMPIPSVREKKRGFQVERGNQSMLGKKKSNPTSSWDEPTVQAQSPSPIIVEAHAS